MCGMSRIDYLLKKSPTAYSLAVINIICNQFSTRSEISRLYQNTQRTVVKRWWFVVHRSQSWDHLVRLAQVRLALHRARLSKHHSFLVWSVPWYFSSLYDGTDGYWSGLTAIDYCLIRSFELLVPWSPSIVTKRFLDSTRRHTSWWLWKECFGSIIRSDFSRQDATSLLIGGDAVLARRIMVGSGVDLRVPVICRQVSFSSASFLRMSQIWLRCCLF